MGQVTPINPSLFDGKKGECLTRADLPPRRNARWLPRHKRAVVAAVHGGLLSMREAMERYELSIEEFDSWEREFNLDRSLHGFQARHRALAAAGN